MNQLVSIVMPAYNREAYIGDSIRSVLAQTFGNWELLVVDDASTDRTSAVVESFRDPRIRLFRHERNHGAALSRNHALREARGKWVAFLDSDDLWHPEKLARQVEFMESSGSGFSCTDYRAQTDGIWENRVWTGPGVADKRAMYRYCWIFTGTVMYDRERMGLLQIPDMGKRNDYVLWLKAVEKCPCHRLRECLAFYRKHGGSISGVKKWKLLKWHYILFRKGLGKGYVSSAFLGTRSIAYGILKRLSCWRALTERDERMTREAEQALSRGDAVRRRAEGARPAGKLSFILLEYHELEAIRGGVERLRATEGAEGAEIVVSSNSGYGEEEQAALRAEMPGVKWVFNERNGGFGYGMNRGMEAATGDLLVAMNADVAIERGFGEMVSFFARA